MPRGVESGSVLSSRIDEGYLGTMGVSILRGRGIEATDTAEAPAVVVVTQAMASQYWAGQDPIGRRVRFLTRDGQPWAQVVGVAADNKFNWIGEAPTPWLYLPQRQDVGRRSTLLVASAGASESLAAAVREIVRELEPNMVIAGVRTIEEFYYGNATGIALGLVRIIGTMGLLGLALAMIGLYGLVAYAVARRTREIGIRMAVGAKPSGVLRSVLGHALLLTGCGVVVGIAGSVAAGRLARGVFPGAGGIDVTVYALVVPSLLGIALLAAYVPARRAARIDPLQALRE